MDVCYYLLISLFILILITGNLYMKYLQSFFLSIILISITSCGGGAESAAPTPAPQNNTPSTNAGNDLTVNENTTVNLSGSGSDPDGNITSYSWSQTSGTAVTLTNANSANVSFVSPSINANEILTFRLVVKDNDGASANDSIDITVINTSADFPITEDNGNLVRYLPNNYIKYDIKITNANDNAKFVEGEITINYSSSLNPSRLDESLNLESLTRTQTIILDNGDNNGGSITSWDVIQFPDDFLLNNDNFGSSLFAYSMYRNGRETILNLINDKSYEVMLLVGSPYIGYYNAKTVIQAKLSEPFAFNTEYYQVFNEVSISAIEIIETPLGSFETFKLDTTNLMTFSNGESEIRTGNSWFHPAIGIVKSNYTIKLADGTLNFEEIVTSTNLNY